MKIKINEINLRRIIKEAFREHFNECEELLTERWSYSDEMDSAMNNVYSAIGKSLQNGKAKMNKISYGSALYIGDTTINLFGINDIKLSFFAYECLDDETCDYIVNNAASRNGYNEDEKQLVITIYMVQGDLIEYYSNKNISHELERILQIANGRKNNIHYSQLMNGAYDTAVKAIQKYDNSNSDFKIIIARLIYYANPHEQDAFMNEYYQELMAMKQFITDKNSETHRRYYDYLHKYQLCIKNLNNPDFINALDVYMTYGYTKRNFIKIIEKGLKRFVKKMNNIEKHFKDTVKRTNESYCKTGLLNNKTLIRLL